jgi:hypothetical protein
MNTKLPLLPIRPLDRESASSPDAWSVKLRGLTQPEALIRIVQENGAVLRTVEAKPILIKAGLAKGQQKNVYGHIFQLMKGTERFAKLGVRWKKIGPGEYRLHPVESDHVSSDDQAPFVQVSESLAPSDAIGAAIVGSGSPSIPSLAKMPRQ